MTIRKDALIIHLFALLHAVVALSCRLLGLQDELILTMLTMLLVVIICMRKGMSTRVMAVCVIGANIAGLLLGRGCALVFSLLFGSPLIINPLSTLITTEIIGWFTLWMTVLLRRKNSFVESDTRGITWLLVAIVVILCVRLIYLLVFSNSLTGENAVLNVILDYVFSCFILLYMADYAVKMSRKAQEDQEKARLAQYSYIKLKQQVNPHFLFNSLNVLDCLVCEQQTDQASTYIHKLAGIYRYMIGSEDRTLVHLRDEMEFVRQYIDLMMVRFPLGLEVEIDIPDEALSRDVVPCSVQMLVENATKHNVVGEHKPLKIRIYVEDNCLVVINNIRPKVSTHGESTGLGLKYIREQYQDVSDHDIEVGTVEDTPASCDGYDSPATSYYVVKLPLL